MYLSMFTLFCCILLHVPLPGSVEAHTGKALCVDWLYDPAATDGGDDDDDDAMKGSSSSGAGVRVVSGGSDCCLHATSVL